MHGMRPLISPIDTVTPESKNEYYSQFVYSLVRAGHLHWAVAVQAGSKCLAYPPRLATLGLQWLADRLTRALRYYHAGMGMDPATCTATPCLPLHGVGISDRSIIGVAVPGRANALANAGGGSTHPYRRGVSFPLSYF